MKEEPGQPTPEQRLDNLTTAIEFELTTYGPLSLLEVIVSMTDDRESNAHATAAQYKALAAQLRRITL